MKVLGLRLKHAVVSLQEDSVAYETNAIAEAVSPASLHMGFGTGNNILGDY
jgi:hypothetical protein